MDYWFDIWSLGNIMDPPAIAYGDVDISTIQFTHAWNIN